MTPEGRVKKNFKHDVMGLPCTWGFMPVSAGLGIHGIPDWIGVRHGKFVAIEFKATDGRATERQKYIHSLITGAGGIVYIVWPESYNFFWRSFCSL